MSVTTAEKAALDTVTAAINQVAQNLTTIVMALEADPVPHPLQVALDAMTAERDAALGQIQDLNQRIQDSLADLDAADQADAQEETADATGDEARARARQKLLGA